jgi:hypothetical protein
VGRLSTKINGPIWSLAVVDARHAMHAQEKGDVKKEQIHKTFTSDLCMYEMFPFVQGRTTEIGRIRERVLRMIQLQEKK